MQVHHDMSKSSPLESLVEFHQQAQAILSHNEPELRERMVECLTSAEVLFDQTEQSDEITADVADLLTVAKSSLQGRLARLQQDLPHVHIHAEIHSAKQELMGALGAAIAAISATIPNSEIPPSVSESGELQRAFQRFEENVFKRSAHDLRSALVTAGNALAVLLGRDSLQDAPADEVDLLKSLRIRIMSCLHADSFDETAARRLLQELQAVARLLQT